MGQRVRIYAEGACHAHLENRGVAKPFEGILKTDIGGWHVGHRPAKFRTRFEKE